MSSSDGASVMKAFFDAMNEHDLDGVVAAADEDIEFVDHGGNTRTRGRDEFRAYCGTYLTGFPDLQLEVTNLFGAGDAAVAEALARGTQDGPLGEIPASSRTIEVPFVLVGRARDGRMVDCREYYDMGTLLTQLGVMPEPAAAG
jgi:steroid delta-isomerase-like uncharacterized protein